MAQQRTAREADEDVTRGTTMTRRRVAIAALLLTLTAVTPAGASATAPTADTARSAGAQRFEPFLRRYEAANTAFVNGDPEPWMTITAHQDPVSIFGGFGGLGDAGLAEVDQRYQLAAGAFRPSGADVDFEYLVKDVRGRLAYTVAIERSDVLYAGHTEVQPQVLRVTMIFRFERGAWSIVHRHADMMVDLQLPTP